MSWPVFLVVAGSVVHVAAAVSERGHLAVVALLVAVFGLGGLWFGA